MKNICRYYTLKYLIEKNQNKLNILIEKRNFNLQDKEIIKLSKYLDKLIVKFDFIDRNTKLIEGVEVS
ncbi:aspartyl-phosphate phosphatase Spo0E family protein [Clostridium sp. DL1XJH146]